MNHRGLALVLSSSARYQHTFICTDDALGISFKCRRCGFTKFVLQELIPKFDKGVGSWIKGGHNLWIYTTIKPPSLINPPIYCILQ